MSTEQIDTSQIHRSNIDPMPEHLKSPLDQAIAARNRGKNAPSPATPMDPLAVKAISAPTPSLHPAVIEAIDGYETDKGYVACAREAFETAHKAIQHVIDARITVDKHSDISTEERVLKVAELASQRQDQATRAFDSALKRLNDGIKAYEEMLTNPLTEKAGLGTVNQELRQKFDSMSAEKREQAINDAIAHKDTSTLRALCGASHLLSGLTRERHAILVRQYHLMTNPEIEKRLAVMVAARTHIETKGPLILTQIEQALGWKWTKVVQAKERHKKVADALRIARCSRL